MNADFLKGHMAANGDSMDDLANALGIHTITLYAKMRGDKSKHASQFTQREIKTIADRYRMTPNDIVRTFFS